MTASHPSQQDLGHRSFLRAVGISWIARFNERARRLRAIIESARPHISRLVAEVTATGRAERVTEDRIRSWREQANIKAAHDSGFAYEAYVRLKLASARSFVSKLIMDIRGVRPGSPFARACLLYTSPSPRD